MNDSPPIGMFGGSGFYDLPDLVITEEVQVTTPFGDPSDAFVVGELSGRKVIFLSRHGRGHLISAPFVNYRANIYGFLKLGVERLVSVGAVGSMKEEYRPTDILVPDQFFDNTKGRESTFFTGTPAVHVDLADPVCPGLSDILYTCGQEVGANIHRGGTYLCMEGPGFSTRAESRIYRSWGVDVIGMTFATEAKLAREAELCYAQLSLVTDYDVWKEGADDVTVETILANLAKSNMEARMILKEVLKRIPAERECSCGRALCEAIVSDPAKVPEEEKVRLVDILGKYHAPREAHR